MGKVVKNLSENEEVYGGVKILPGCTYPITNSMELSQFQNDSGFINALCVTPAKALVFEDSAPGVLITGSQAVQFLFDSRPTNLDLRPIVHATPRKIGTYTYYTGCGDDPSNLNNIGGDIVWSRMLTFFSAAENNEPVKKEVVFNSINNETYIFQGIVEYINAENDFFSMRIVAQKSEFVSGQAGTSYELDPESGIFLPAQGLGTYSIDNPILIEMPLNEHGTRHPGFWDAGYDTSSGVFYNITPNMLGEGRFNIFSTEVDVHQFGYAVPVLVNGMKALTSHDNSQIGHNMKLIFEAHTNIIASEGGGPHEWMSNITLILYRKKTV